MVQRWTFYDPETLTTEEIFLNPQEMELPTKEKNITISETTAPGPDGRTILAEGARKAQTLSFKGVALTLDQIDFLDALFEKDNQVRLTDDFDRQWWIVIFKFGLTRTRTMRPHTELHRYTMEAYVLDWPT